MSGSDHDELIALLIDKDQELKRTMARATEQDETEKKIQALMVEVKKQDDAIKELQKKFKEAETTLSTAIFQAQQKLDSIDRARGHPVPSEDLIKYAHRISASNAVCAPLNWQQGDPRRPYPTDMEMRLGFLGRPETNLPVGGSASTITRPGGLGGDFHLSPHPAAAGAGPPGMIQPSPTKMHGAPPPPVPPAGHPGQFSWHGGEMSLTGRDGASIPIETNNHHPGEVDVMSTDSSSSSSTDSN